LVGRARPVHSHAGAGLAAARLRHAPVTGYAPFLALEGRFRLSSVLALLVAAALIRWQAIGHTGAALAVEGLRERLVEGGLWRWGVLSGVAIWAVAAAVAAAYGLMHPLSGGYAVDYEPSNYSYVRTGDQHVYVFRGPPGTHAGYTIDVRNAGFAGVTFLSVDVPAGSGFRLAGFSLAASPNAAPSGREVEGRESVWLNLQLRLAACEGKGLSVLRDVVVRYLILGRVEDQRVALDPAPAVRCS
jgi:hypothetical protein